MWPEKLDGAAHRLGIRAEASVEILFGQGLPTTDDTSGVVDIELVTLVFEQLLDAGGDVGFVDGEDDDDGDAGALRRDAEMDADPSACMTSEEFKRAVGK